MNLGTKIAATVACGAALLGLLYFLAPAAPEEMAAKTPAILPIAQPPQPSVKIRDAVAPSPAATPEPKQETVAPAARDSLKIVNGKVYLKAGQSIPELFPHQSERDELMRLATTYDPANIPAIAKSLSHSDATVREAARQALIQIGDRSAIPHLKAAKTAARDPEEAESLRETIEFLELPHITDVLKLSAEAAQSQTP